MSAPQVNLTFPNGGKSSFSGGLFINNEFVPAQSGKTLAVINPATGKEIAQVAEADAKDIDIAVKAAREAYNNVWGEKVPGHKRGRLLLKLADLVEQHIDELAAIESLDNGKPVSIAKGFDFTEVIANLRYYAGWADKNHGKVIEVDSSKLTYTRHEPVGVCGQIIPWNFPALMFAWKIAPALATGNTIVLKVAEQTPLSGLRMCQLIKEAGFPTGVVNVVAGFGPTAGAAIAAHMDIDKVAFTGSTLVGRNIMKAAASTNLKKVTLELGGKSPNIILKDADLEQAVSWAAFGFSFNTGQCCCAGTRVYVEEAIYEKFMEKLLVKVKSIKTGDGFQGDTFQGPQVSQLQFDRVMGYIQQGKADGAKVLTGGERHGTEGYFVQPTVFTDVNPDSKISREEIFGPVVVVHKFKDQQDLIRIANDSIYGLAAAVFSRDVSRALETAHALKAGTVWVNCYNQINPQVPFGGYKASGIGRELGEYALSNYTNVKAVHVNLNIPAPL
ncbi:indole-3-acetaldehyde dehydrogenase [Tilletiaria anomala UBC 951]|uniref:Indole-3-acetaldehyde dehydrogenase n=1 Tax=Tilletiaria anomala (strain ATCC 24038 / CBS 436.72 / UBC 951) TaxID=1037660 RepID=A0A066W565_TILAU|nr:indole-3-acetaldehyde dehydrogenase [Tilletiaria anomala UBC 951]KDN48841.1 indole-3-acetaldehyde dehydrogenase [Tilletiaria anomala UBC 951]